MFDLTGMTALVTNSGKSCCHSPKKLGSSFLVKPNRCSAARIVVIASVMAIVWFMFALDRSIA